MLALLVGGIEINDCSCSHLSPCAVERVVSLLVQADGLHLCTCFLLDRSCVAFLYWGRREPVLESECCSWVALVGRGLFSWAIRRETEHTVVSSGELLNYLIKESKYIVLPPSPMKHHLPHQQ